jgi:hypothetical protein
MVHVEVTTKDAPENALERGQTGAINDASDEPVMRLREQKSRRKKRILEVERDVRRGRILVFPIFMLE